MSEGPDTRGVAVSVVVLAHGPEPLLGDCVHALLSSVGPPVEVIVVDNGCTTDAVERIPVGPQVRVVRPFTNTGFAGGANLGAAEASGGVIVFVNSDAVVAPDAVAALAAALEDHRVGIASGSLRLLDQPNRMNSAGNPVHFLGLSWAGGLGDLATAHGEGRQVASATGAVMALRRDTWNALGGFFEPMFAYCEDVELSLRCWQRGWSVVYVPQAVAWHAYEFHRNDLKMYLLERNRLITVLTSFERRTLALLAPALAGLEVAVLAVALKQGWWREKVRGWWWLARHVQELSRRRACVQASRSLSDGSIAPMLTGSFDPGVLSGFAVPRWLSALSSCYWAGVRRAIR